jgi:hypothetical protein
MQTIEKCQTSKKEIALKVAKELSEDAAKQILETAGFTAQELAEVFEDLRQCQIEEVQAARQGQRNDLDFFTRVKKLDESEPVAEGKKRSNAKTCGQLGVKSPNTLAPEKIELGISLAADGNRPVTEICKEIGCSRSAYYRLIHPVIKSVAPEPKIRVSKEKPVKSLKQKEIKSLNFPPHGGRLSAAERRLGDRQRAINNSAQLPRTCVEVQVPVDNEVGESPSEPQEGEVRHYWYLVGEKPISPEYELQNSDWKIVKEIPIGYLVVCKSENLCNEIPKWLADGWYLDYRKSSTKPSLLP